MIYYKSYRIIDGKPKLVIIDEDGNIIKNPTKEQKKDAILEDYNTYRINNPKRTVSKIKGRMCCKCDIDLSSGKPNHGRRYFDDKGEWDEKSWICDKCYNESSMLKTQEIREKYGYKPQESYLRGRNCCVCNMGISSGINHWRRYFDDKGEWDEKSWICEKCYNELQKIKRGKLREQRLKENIQNLGGIKCCICGGSDTYIYQGRPKWIRYYVNNIWDRKSYMCSYCGGKIMQSIPDSQNNLRKSITNIRTGNLRINSETGKSIMDQAVVVKAIGGKDINIEMDKFDYFIDIKHKKYGTVDVKGAVLKYQTYLDTRGDTLIYYRWMFPTRRKVDCNTYICIGYDSERKNVEMVWIIPNEGWVCNLSNIDIYKTFRSSKYDPFKVDPKTYNDAYISLMLYLGDRKFFGIDDIKRWLSIS